MLLYTEKNTIKRAGLLGNTQCVFIRIYSTMVPCNKDVLTYGVMTITGAQAAPVYVVLINVAGRVFVPLCDIGALLASLGFRRPHHSERMCRARLRSVTHSRRESGNGAALCHSERTL